MNMHCHLCESVLDVGPVYSQLNTIMVFLEGMPKTWHAPEVQRLHKITDLHTFLYFLH